MREKEILSLFGKVVSAYEEVFGLDLSHMKVMVGRQPLFANGRPCFDMDPDECGGDWTELGFARINPDLEAVAERYGISLGSEEDLIRFAESVIAHELAHEVFRKGMVSDSEISAVLLKCADEGFSTPYLETVREEKLPEETFCEWMANAVVSALSKEKDPVPAYEPPYSADEVLEKYGRETFEMLWKDPCHRWRMETGIELVHREPDAWEFRRILANWKAMDPWMKEESDRKSQELFGCSNLEHAARLERFYAGKEEEAC